METVNGVAMLSCEGGWGISRIKRSPCMNKLVTKYSYSGLSEKGYYNEPVYINLLTRSIKLNY